MEQNYFEGDYIPEQAEKKPFVQPHNIDAEKSVLGAMLISKEATATCAEALRDEDFYLQKHSELFSVMIELFNTNHPVDVVTVTDALERRGKLAATGGVTYVTELSLFTPTASNVTYYLDIVKDHSTRRRLIRTGTKLVQEAQNSEIPTQNTLEGVERRIFEIMTNKREDSLVQVRDIAFESYERMGELMNSKGGLSGTSTGFIDLDKTISGLQKNDLIIVAARPSMGKTAFALNIATHVALREHKHVAIFSLEMSSIQLMMRVFCSEAGVDMQSIRTGQSSSDGLVRIAEVAGEVASSNMYIDETNGITVSEIRSKCRRLKARAGLDLIVIDYLQLMQSTSKSDNRVQIIAEMTGDLKRLARELELPIILLAQLSREPEKRKENPRPIMSDLRESGAIEQDADIIMMLYRPAFYGKSNDNVCEIVVTKNRNGPIGIVKLAWVPEYTKFTNSAYGMEEG